MRPRGPAGALLASVVLLAACGGGEIAPEPRPISTEPAHRLVAGANEVGDLRCGAPAAAPFGVHLELFVDGLVVLVPAGIGIRAPWEADAAYVRSGACELPVVTHEPTGVIEVERPGLTLGDLFAIWGEPLSQRGFAGFTGIVRAHVGGVEVRGDPAAIPLGRHAQIVLQVGEPRIAPHARYTFPAPL